MKQRYSRKKTEEAYHFQHLGALTDSDLNDLIGVKHRALKSSQNFGRFRVSMFCNRKFSRKTKLTVYRAICIQAALCGCESWSVTAEIERHLEGSQFQQLKQTLGITTTQQIDERISKAQVLQRAGLGPKAFFSTCAASSLPCWGRFEGWVLGSTAGFRIIFLLLGIGTLACRITTKRVQGRF